MKMLGNRAQISIEMLFIVGLVIVLAAVAGLVLKNIFTATSRETTPKIGEVANQASGN